MIRLPGGDAAPPDSPTDYGLEVVGVSLIILGPVGSWKLEAARFAYLAYEPLLRQPLVSAQLVAKWAAARGERSPGKDFFGRHVCALDDAGLARALAAGLVHRSGSDCRDLRLLLGGPCHPRTPPNMGLRCPLTNGSIEGYWFIDTSTNGC